ncbi:PEGA domain-containing protein [Methanogenium organophilum]|uniref:PEGA domain-containing protein n=1 Tax=Methanogenium organophilum TaxID=2199 RepID=A0A9X9T871_METOG|nr:PEGA domain-containing protein [Methanogenium organophilum]WAI02108.1 PEGA domain-containing protein [Methanogenium organophilum]
MKWVAPLLIFCTLAAGAVFPAGAATPEQPIAGIAHYDIYTNVDAADIYFDGVYMGRTAAGYLQLTVETPSPYTRAMASRAGYNNAYANLPTASPGGIYSISLILTSIAPSYGTLSVTSSPTGASVYIDNVYKGLTPQQVSLIHNQYTLRLEHSGYNRYTQQIWVYGGQTTTVNAALVPSTTYGTISVSSSPSLANIYLDGSFRGTTTQTISGLNAGSYFVELTKPGYQDWTGSVRVYPGQVTSVFQTLVPVQSPTTGALSVTSNPSYAAVYLDGGYQGQTAPGTPLVISAVTAGSHTVTVRLSGYKDSVSTVTVNSGQTTTVSAELIPSGGGSGTLSVTSSPAGADVYVNNVRAGITPVTSDEMTPGTYTVAIRLAGYTEWSAETEVTAGSTSYVSASLTPLPAQSPPSLFLPAGVLIALGGFFLCRRKEREY